MGTMIPHQPGPDKTRTRQGTARVIAACRTTAMCPIVQAIHEDLRRAEALHEDLPDRGVITGVTASVKPGVTPILRVWLVGITPPPA
jgi:hypothetical protein